MIPNTIDINGGVLGRDTSVPVSGLDHVGLTVANLRLAVSDLGTLFGGGQCYIEGPIFDKEPGWMQRKLGASADDFTLHVAAVSVGGFNLELFEYKSSQDVADVDLDENQEFFGFIYHTPTPMKFIARHIALFRSASGANAGWSSLVTRSGLRIFVTQSKQESLSPALFIGPRTFRALEGALCGHFGMLSSGALTMPCMAGKIFRGKQGGELAVLLGPHLQGRPSNSDVGGHHVAFYANDVDAASEALSGLGYNLMGTPEMILDGPIAGDRWLYVMSPFGVQMEVINMPDGHLPYEADAKFLRSSISRKE